MPNYKYVCHSREFYFFEVWDLADTQKNGYLTRDGLYKAFALIALSQQGKNVSEKSLELLIDAGNMADYFYYVTYPTPGLLFEERLNNAKECYN